MKRIFIKTVAILLLIGSISHNVNAEDSPQFYFAGFINDTPFAELNVEVFLFRDYYEHRQRLDADQIKFDRQNTNGKISMDTMPEISFLRITSSLGSKDMDERVRNVDFPIFRGDSIKLVIQEDTVMFYGKGSERLNCLIAMEKYDWSYLNTVKEIDGKELIPNESFQMLEEERWSDFLDLKVDQIRFLYEKRISMIDAAAQFLNGKEIALLKLLVKSWAGTEFMSNMYIFVQSKDESARKIALEALDELYSQLPIEYKNQNLAVRAHNYVDFIWNKEYMSLSLLKTAGNKISFEEMISHIMDHFPPGPIREKLIATSIANKTVKLFEISYEQYDKLLAHITTPHIRNIITSYQTLGNALNPAYAFDLPDSSGVHHKLSDFVDKLLVVEFWFTGCIPCIRLNEAMEPVVEYYKDRSDVVFLSVNMDKKRENWINSLNNGLRDLGQYTHPCAINLSTLPQGIDHPMMKFYQFNGAPQLIIIGKKGEILSTSPPKPSIHSKTNTKRLIAMINHYLDNN